MTLEREKAWYEANRASLLAEHTGKWIVVFGERLVGVYDSFATAYSEGVRQTGSEDILVRRVVEKDEPFSAPALTVGILRAPVYHENAV